MAWKDQLATAVSRKAQKGAHDEWHKGRGKNVACQEMKANPRATRSPAPMSMMGGHLALILATIAVAGGLACAAGSSGLDGHRRVQAVSCSSYFEVTAAANAVEAACCPPGSSFAVWPWCWSVAA